MSRPRSERGGDREPAVLLIDAGHPTTAELAAVVAALRRRQEPATSPPDTKRWSDAARLEAIAGSSVASPSDLLAPGPTAARRRRS